jgi:hypothetical protein
MTLKRFLSIFIFRKLWEKHHNRILGLHVSYEEGKSLLAYGIDYDIWSKLFDVYYYETAFTPLWEDGWVYYKTLWQWSPYPLFKKIKAFLFE